MSEYDARLADRVRTRGVLGPDDAARLLLPVAEALAALHARGGAHGALSPAALQIDPEGRATLLDTADVAPDPSYRAPDHPSAGLHARPAADDVWAFAALLLFVTTGATPQAGRAPVAGTRGLRDIGWLGPITELALVADPRERPSAADVAAYLRARVDGTAPAGRARRPSGALLAIGGAVLVVGLALAGAAMLFVGSGDEDPADHTSAPSGVPSERAPQDAEDGNGGPTEDPERVSAAELEDFARDYIALASRDPERGFRLLTPSYQQQSPRYREVWAAIDDPRILAITPDPLAMSVSYTYRYSLPGGATRTEDITLRLVRRGERLLIAGASAR